MAQLPSAALDTASCMRSRRSDWRGPIEVSSWQKHDRVSRQQAVREGGFYEAPTAEHR